MSMTAALPATTGEAFASALRYRLAEEYLRLVRARHAADDMQAEISRVEIDELRALAARNDVQL